MSRSLRTSALVIALLAAITLAPLGVTARTHATPTPTATPSLPPEDPAVTLIARREFVAWQAGVVNPDHYEKESQANLSPDKIADTAKNLGALGTLESTDWLGPIGVEDPPPNVKGAYLYKMHCENADVYEELTMATDGKVMGIIFRDKLPKP